MTQTTAPISDAIIAGRMLAEYKSFREFPGHHHSNDMIVGYAVRETVRDGKILWHGKHIGPSDMHEHCGYDIAATEGAGTYADTFELRDSYRRTPGGYAVVDRLYSCGCRS